MHRMRATATTTQQVMTVQGKREVKENLLEKVKENKLKKRFKMKKKRNPMKVRIVKRKKRRLSNLSLKSRKNAMVSVLSLFLRSITSFWLENIWKLIFTTVGSKCRRLK